MVVRMYRAHTTMRVGTTRDTYGCKELLREWRCLCRRHPLSRLKIYSQTPEDSHDCSFIKHLDEFVVSRLWSASTREWCESGAASGRPVVDRPPWRFK